MNNFFELLRKAATDSAFREKFKKNPKPFLKECGLTYPENTQIILVENTNETLYFALPTQQRIQELYEFYSKKSPEAADVFKKLSLASFRSQLKENPRKILTEELKISPKQKYIEILEDTEETFYIVIPHASEFEEISDEQLNQIAAGYQPPGFAKAYAELGALPGGAGLQAILPYNMTVLRWFAEPLLNKST